MEVGGWFLLRSVEIGGFSAACFWYDRLRRPEKVTRKANGKAKGKVKRNAERKGNGQAERAGRPVEVGC